MAIITEPIDGVANIICGGDSVTEFAFGDSIDKRWTTIANTRARETLGLPVGGSGYRPAVHSGTLPGPSYEGSPVTTGYGFGRLSKALVNLADTVIWDNVVGTSFDLWYADSTGQGAISVEIDGPLNPTNGYLPPLPSNEVVYCASVPVNSSSIGSSGTADIIVYFDSPDYTITPLRASLGGFQSVLRLDLGGPTSGFNGKLMMSGLGTGSVAWNAQPVAVTGWTDGTGRFFKASLNVATDTVTYWFSNQAKTTARASITWTQIGSAVALSTPITGLMSQTTAVIGNIDSVTAGTPWNGKIYRHCCLVNGSVAWDMDFTKQLNGAWFFEDEIGNRWNTYRIGTTPAGGSSSSFTKLVQTDPCGTFVTAYESLVNPFIGADKYIRIPLPNLSTHQVRAKHYAKGAGLVPDPIVSGIDPHRSDETVGINFINAGHGGYQCFNMVGNGLDARITQQVDILDAIGLVLFFGFNERGAAPPYNDPVVFRGYVEDYIQAARIANPTIEVLLVGGWEPGGAATTYPWSDYIDQLSMLSTSFSYCSFLNVYPLWPKPGTTAGDASGRYADTVHLNGDVGNPDFADLLLSRVISESALTHKITWDAVPERTYEQGVDRGVIAVEDMDVIPWNGLISVNEVEIGDTILRSAFDGMTYANLKFGGAYQCAVQTFSFPDYVDACIGNLAVYPGLTLTAQPRVPFHFSYRSMVGADAYKLHFVYNAMASQKKREANTIGKGAEPAVYEFLIDTVPVPSSIFRPTAHVVIDTTKANPADVAAVETMLYGTTVDEPQFPGPLDLISIFG